MKVIQDLTQRSICLGDSPPLSASSVRATNRENCSDLVVESWASWAHPGAKSRSAQGFFFLGSRSMDLLVFAIGFEIILNFGKLCLSLRHDKISSLNTMNYIFFRVDIHIL